MKTKDLQHGICWHQQAIEVEINTPFSASNNYTHLQEQKIPVECGLKIIGCDQLLESLVNSGETYLALALTDTGGLQLNFVFSFSI